MEELIYQCHLGVLFPRYMGPEKYFLSAPVFYLIGKKRKRPLFTFGFGHANFANKKMKFDMAKNPTDRRQTCWLYYAHSRDYCGTTASYLRGTCTRDLRISSLALELLTQTALHASLVMPLSWKLTHCFLKLWKF